MIRTHHSHTSSAASHAQVPKVEVDILTPARIGNDPTAGAFHLGLVEGVRLGDVEVGILLGAPMRVWKPVLHLPRLLICLVHDQVRTGCHMSRNVWGMARMQRFDTIFQDGAQSSTLYPAHGHDGTNLPSENPLWSKLMMMPSDYYHSRPARYVIMNF
jgi:hypothetical protein